jgi:hypothetical protein
MSVDGKELAIKKFSFHLDVSVDPPVENAPSSYETLSMNQPISFIYNENAHSLLLFDSNNRFVDQKDISNKVDYIKEKSTLLLDQNNLCGNSRCDSTETIDNCSQDCHAFIAPAQTNNILTTRNIILLFLALVIIITMIATYFYFIKSKKNHSPEE